MSMIMLCTCNELQYMIFRLDLWTMLAAQLCNLYLPAKLVYRPSQHVHLRMQRRLIMC